ncbi:MAG: sugar kinase [Candidatus Heimdallarchaeota archaeon]|nr:sugar kinase [Candidatus Heimdallarchaeota archaeon]
MTLVDNIVIVRKKTWLEELIVKYNTKDQAKFYIESMGGSFEEYENAHKVYYKSLERLKRFIPTKTSYQVIERDFLPNFLFGPNDLVVVIGPDGLVINSAKYLDKQRILAVNPDPNRIDGLLIPFGIDEFPKQLKTIINDDEIIKQVTLAKAELSTRMKTYAVNDLFIGHKSHMSAKYTITYQGETERQSSSGIVISTGIGSTGWLKGIVYGAARIVDSYHSSYKIDTPEEEHYRFPWDANYLFFAVREPWESQITKTNIVFGKIFEGEYLEIESNMSENGVIFSDGIEKDYVEFLSGTIAKIEVAEKKVHLIVKE